jgi:hypothetical protein
MVSARSLIAAVACILISGCTPQSTTSAGARSLGHDSNSRSQFPERIYVSAGQSPVSANVFLLEPGRPPKAVTHLTGTQSVSWLTANGPTIIVADNRSDFDGIDRVTAGGLHHLVPAPAYTPAVSQHDGFAFASVRYPSAGSRVPSRFVILRAQLARPRRHVVVWRSHEPLASPSWLKSTEVAFLRRPGEQADVVIVGRSGKARFIALPHRLRKVTNLFAGDGALAVFGPRLGAVLDSNAAKVVGYIPKGWVPLFFHRHSLVLASGSRLAFWHVGAAAPRKSFATGFNLQVFQGGT